LDTEFDINTSGTVSCVSLQADGKIIIGGDFTLVGGTKRNHIARLNPDGTLDKDFDPDTDFSVYNVLVQSDGRVVIGGFFTRVGGILRNRLARLLNESASQILTVPDASRIQWLRGGASPEAQIVSFEISTVSGTNWLPLGRGTRVIGGWELTGLTLPANGIVRARARVPNGNSSGLIEARVSFPSVPLLLLSPVMAADRFRFLLPTTSGLNYQVQFAPALMDMPPWTTIREVNGDGTTNEMAFPASTPAGFYRVLANP
jgi:hypothetical protein